jgi:hypothetical protein
MHGHQAAAPHANFRLLRADAGFFVGDELAIAVFETAHLNAATARRSGMRCFLSEEATLGRSVPAPKA